MTFAPPPVSNVADRRISAANMALWAIAAFVLAVSGSVAAYQALVDPYGIFGYASYNFPWEAENPTVATETDGVWRADAGGAIRIPASQFTEPLLATLVTGRDVTLYRVDPRAVSMATGEVRPPQYLGFLDRSVTQVILSTGDDLELWVGAEGAWALTLTPLEVIELTDEGASGAGNAYLLYTGDATSARFIHPGEGNFFVSTHDPYDRDWPITERGAVDQRLSWDPDLPIVFEIESEGAWVVDVDRLASSSSAPTPTPTETP